VAIGEQSGNHHPTQSSTNPALTNPNAILTLSKGGKPHTSNNLTSQNRNYRLPTITRPSLTLTILINLRLITSPNNTKISSRTSVQPTCHITQPMHLRRHRSHARPALLLRHPNRHQLRNNVRHIVIHLIHQMMR
jgi:hypothetical protein